MQLATHRNRGGLVGAVVGGAVGGFVVFVIVILLLFTCRRRRRQRARIDQELDRTAVQPFGVSSPHPILLLVQFLNPLPAVPMPRKRSSVLDKAERNPRVARTAAQVAEKHAETRPIDDAETRMAEREDLWQQIATVDERGATIQGTPGEGMTDSANPRLPVTGRPNRPVRLNNTAFSREVATLRAELARLRLDGLASLAVGPPPAYG